jgi:hypothetical protein
MLIADKLGGYRVTQATCGSDAVLAPRSTVAYGWA